MKTRSKTKQQKKSWCKYWYILALMIVLLVGCSSDVTTSSNDSQKKTETSTVEERLTEVENSTFTIGEQIILKTSKGQYNLTITSVSETTARNQFSKTEADRVIIIDYIYENVSQEYDLFISDMSFKAYDANGTALKTYPVTITYAQGVGAGRNASAQMAFALNNSTDKIELEYYDNMFNSKSDALIVLSW